MQIRGEHRRGSCVPPLVAQLVIETRGGANVVGCKFDSSMSLRVSDFAAVQRAAFCAARVAVSASIGSGGGVIWGVSDPLCHPPITAPCFSW
jgi:hypothetical protein